MPPPILTLGWTEERNPTSERLRYVFDHMDDFKGVEGFGISMTDDATEWQLVLHSDGRVVWMRSSYDVYNPRHMVGVTREKQWELWQRLAAGEIVAIEAEPWQQGFPPGDSEPRSS